jgi:glycosyltransferase involved in cell wall biosynthesis
MQHVNGQGCLTGRNLECRKFVKIQDRKIVVVNQAVNYLTIGFANAFKQRFGTVALITGSIHIQGEELDRSIGISWINKWQERPVTKKFVSYLVGCFRIYWLLVTRYKGYEVFFVSLPPMAYLLSLVLPHRCSIVIWDVYPDVFRITGMSNRHPVYRIWAALNRRTFRKAYRIFTIGDRMADLLSAYVDRKKILVQPIWSIFQSNGKVARSDNPFIKRHRVDGKFIVQYSGNIGLTHKVELMVSLAELMKDHPNILFQIIGRGPRVPLLQRMVSDRKLPNCQFLPFQSDEMFPFSLASADIGVVILDEQTSKGSVPSKSYNLMSYGIPALYVASGDSELANYAQKYGHAFCCREAELHQAVAFILDVSRNSERWAFMSRKAEQASHEFRRKNADMFIEVYIDPPVQQAG